MKRTIVRSCLVESIDFFQRTPRLPLSIAIGGQGYAKRDCFETRLCGKEGIRGS